MRTQTPAQRAVDTRRVYAFEDQAKRYLGDYFTQDTSIVELRDIADVVWDIFGGKKKMPRIVAGNGVMFGGRWMSYSQAGVGIVMARSQRNVFTLIHELTHYLGYDDHDKKFVKKYFTILCRFGAHEELLELAREHFDLP